MSITDAELLEEIQYAVLEPPDQGATWPSNLWSSAEVLGYANQRQNRLLRDTLLLVGQADLTVTAGNGTPALPIDWLRTVRVVWRGSDGVVRPLHRTDSFALDCVSEDWQTTRGTPLVYMDEEGLTLTTTIGPPPDVDGQIDLFYVPLGDLLALSPDLLNIPDEAAPGLKYAILADMLSKDGRGHDDGRAQYCEARYQMVVEGIEMLMRGWGN